MSSFSSNGTASPSVPMSKSQQVHQAAGGVGRLVVRGLEATPALVLVERHRVAGIEDEVLDAHLLEALVAGQLGHGHVTLHALLLVLGALVAGGSDPR
jgi:hypothetical protein